MPRRPAGRRQDLARQVDRARHGPRVRAHEPGRRARRSRNPRPPAHLYRLDAGQDHPVDEEGENLQSAVPARRGRQARRRLARRSVGGAARGARSGAEPDLQRPLSRGRFRSVGRDVHHHGQHAAHAAAADGPHGDHPHPRLHRGREGRDRQAPSDPQAAQAARARRTASGRSPTRRCAISSATTRARRACAISNAKSPTSRARR